MSTDQWRKENTKQYNLRVLVSSGIPEALEVACQKAGVSTADYIRTAIVEKLVSDKIPPKQTAEKKTYKPQNNMEKSDAE